MNVSAKRRRLLPTCLIALVFAFSVMTGGRLGATQVWTGPSLTFQVPAGSDWTQATNQDRITSNVWFARSTLRGLFNAFYETSYASYYSPSNTTWAYGALTDYAMLSYASWETWNGHNPPTMVGQDAVVHIISSDIYLALHFNSWGGAGGGFSYTRSTPAIVPEPSAASLAIAGMVIVLCLRPGRKALAIPHRQRVLQMIPAARFQSK